MSVEVAAHEKEESPHWKIIIFPGLLKLCGASKGRGYQVEKSLSIKLASAPTKVCNNRGNLLGDLCSRHQLNDSSIPACILNCL